MNKMQAIVILLISTFCTQVYSRPTSTSRTTTHEPPRTVYCSNHREFEKEFPRHGDLVCEVEQRIACTYDGILGFHDILLSRDTVLSTEDPQMQVGGELLHYRKNIAQKVFRVNVLNFGDVNGFVKEVTVVYRNGESDVQVVIEAPLRKEVKLFVEIYGCQKPQELFKTFRFGK